MTQSKMSEGLGTVTANSFREWRGFLSLTGCSQGIGAWLVVSRMSALEAKAPRGRVTGPTRGTLALGLVRSSPK